MDDSYKILKFKAPDLPDSYKGVVYAFFLRTLRQETKAFKQVDGDSFFNYFNRYLTWLLTHDTCVVRLAVMEPDVVIGWSLTDGKRLHYVWVQQAGREQGIATSLVPGGFEVFSNLTDLGKTITDLKFPKAKFKPFTKGFV